MEIIRILKECEQKKALVFGMGGGGDIVSTIPVANFLKLFDFKIIYGGVLWDRLIIDPKPGPRAIEELENAEKFNEVIALLKENCRTNYGIKPNLARSAKQLGEVLALDITKGAKKLARGLEEFIAEKKIGITIGVDAGGDALAVGYESGVRSPLADAMSVAVLNEINGFVSVVGIGSDGELKFEELMLNIAEIYKKIGFLGCSSITSEDCKEMLKLCEDVVTEASRIPIMAHRGELGLKKIRKGRTVLITPISALIFYFRAKSVFEMNETAMLIRDCENIEEANRVLNKNGIITELDYERLVSDVKIT
ncbi:MAG: DUF1152 domain-containing protein [Archaeoglobaceae archaeon]|nr:DUF1152 domain-containing protein [Archaeoglobaceae archaeon]MDW8118214.1 DUF1152 domain-containing protein [Archaeoglobaceae archaeon]